MPKRAYVLGVKDANKKAQLEEMLAYVDPPEQFKGLVFLPEFSYQETLRRHGIDKPHSPMFTHLESGRTYTPDIYLDNEGLLENFLSHEWGHMASGEMKDEASAEQAAKPFRVFLKGFRNLQKNKQVIKEGKLPLLRKDSGTGFNTLKPPSSL